MVLAKCRGGCRGLGWRKPLLRSGVLLAGFKTWLKGGSLPAEAVRWAADRPLAMRMFRGWICWRRSWWCCRLARRAPGEVRTGEGVFGLRRAFVLAGAKTLVMSLWKVPDLATAILMERFYDNLLNRRDSSNRPFSRSESLREARFHARDVTVVKSETAGSMRK
ncbi:MAG: CHAT domain-containing protein [Blastocatellia bacterium]